MKMKAVMMTVTHFFKFFLLCSEFLNAPHLSPHRPRCSVQPVFTSDRVLGVHCSTLALALGSGSGTMARIRLLCTTAAVVWVLWCGAAVCADGTGTSPDAQAMLPIMTNLTLERSFRGVWRPRVVQPQRASGTPHSPLTAAEGTFFLMKLKQYPNQTHVGSSASTRVACDLVKAELVLRDGNYIGDQSANLDVYGVFVPSYHALLLYTGYLRMKGNRVSHTLDMGTLGDGLAATRLRAGSRAETLAEGSPAVSQGTVAETGPFHTFMEQFVHGDFLTKQAQEKLAAAKNKCPLLLAMQLSLDTTVDGKKRQGVTPEGVEREAQDTKLYGGPRDAVLLSGLMRGQTCDLDTAIQARYLSPLDQERATTLYVWLILVVTAIDITVFRMQYSATSSSQAVCYPFLAEVFFFCMVFSPLKCQQMTSKLSPAMMMWQCMIDLFICSVNLVLSAMFSLLFFNSKDFTLPQLT